MATGAAVGAPGQRNEGRPSFQGGRRSATILRDFSAPDFGTLRRWPGFSDLTRTAQAVLQHLCALLDGRGVVVVPAHEIAYDLAMSVRSVRSAYLALRLSGLILTTETRNRRGGTGRLKFVPGRVLLNLANYREKTAPSSGPSTRDLRGANSSSPTPDRGEEASSFNLSTRRKKHRDIEVAREARKTEAGGRAPPGRKEDAPADGRRVIEPPSPGAGSGDGADVVPRRRQRRVSPQASLVASCEAALGSGSSLSSADRKLLRVAAPIALEHGLEAVLLNVCRYVGRARWAKAKGAVVRQRFIDALDHRGLGDVAVPPQWQSLRRQEAVRIDRNQKLTELHDDVPPAPPAPEPRAAPATVGDVLMTGDFRELLRQNGVELNRNEG